MSKKYAIIFHEIYFNIIFGESDVEKPVLNKIYF
jgi:hypothetical protein